MLAQIRKILVPPLFADEEETRAALILHTMLITVLAAYILTYLAFALTAIATGQLPTDLAITFIRVGLIGGLLYLTRRGHFKLTTVGLLLLLIWIIAHSAVLSGGVNHPVIAGFLIVVIVAGLLLGGYAAIGFALFNTLLLWAIHYVQSNNLLDIPALAVSPVIIYAVLFIVTALLLRLVTNSIAAAVERARRSHDELQQLTASLEERVNARTQDLALAAEIGRRISQRRSLDKLLLETVHLIQSQFGVYYVQVYLTDDVRRVLLLRAGSGEVGRQLVQQGHRLPLDLSSINGMAATEKHPVIVADTTASHLFRPNLLLPSTRAEIAIPLIVGDRVVGVLNLQSQQPQAFSSENLPAFEALAGQLAVAIENANLFAEARAARAEVESRAQVLARQNWQTYLDAIERAEHFGFTYDRADFKPLDEPLPQEPAGTLTAPITITGEPVGLIQLENDGSRSWPADAVTVVDAVARQVAQQIENLRLLDEAARYRQEAEEAMRRLTREGWRSYKSEESAAPGYVYTQNQVLPIAGIDQLPPAPDEAHDVASQPLLVRGQPIGLLEIAAANPDEKDTNILAAVAGQLSAHIENLRLTTQTEQALAEAERRSQELAIINRLVSAVATSRELNQSIQIVADELAQALTVEQVRIALLDETGQSLSVIAEHYDPARSPSALGFTIPVAGNLLTQQVLETRQPVLVADAQHNPLTAPVHEGMRQQGIHALVVLPMLAGNQVIGTVGLDILDQQAPMFDDEQLRLAQTLVLQAATAVQNARLFEQTQAALVEVRQSERLMESLYQASAEMNAAQDYEDILAILQRHTPLGHDGHLSLNYFERPWLGNQAPEWVEILARTGNAAGLSNRRLRLQDLPSAGRLLGPETPTLIEDIDNDPRLDDATREFYQAQLGARSVIFVPLVVGGQWIGFINATYREQKSFSEAEIRRLMTLAAQAAVATQSIHLLRQAESRARREQILREITAHVRSSADVETIMQTAVEQVGRALGKKAFIYLSDTGQAPASEGSGG